MSVKPEIVADSDARRLLADEAFLGAWRGLAARDAKFTLLQEPEFALAWYRAYADTHAPLLVSARAGDGELLGLLPLAQEAGTGALVHAGAHQAEYHGWLATPEHDQEFLVQALLELRRTVGFGSWSWRWMPPGAASAWTDSPELRGAGIHAVSEERAAPIWDLRQRDKLDKILASSAIRSKVNRYKRRGAYRFERITEPARAAALLSVLSRQCDYRQEVLHAVRPFADDPRKAAFFRERLAYPAANHFSVLWCGDEPLALHCGVTGRGTCLLGLAAYSPAESRNSPGTLLLVELARALTAEGCHELDLTPGTDPYKLRFANGERRLCRPTLHTSRYRRLRSRVLVAARARVQRAAATRELEVQERLQRCKRELGHAARELASGRLGGLARRAREGLWAERAYACLRLERPVAPARADLGEVRVQAYADLMEYDRRDPFPSRRALLAEAEERFSDGEVLYSVRVDGRLALIGWRAGKSGAAHDALQRLAVLGEGASLLYAFTDLAEPAAPGAFEACLWRMQLDAAAAGEGQVVVCIERRDAAKRAAAERLGFRGGCVAVRRNVLGRGSSWRLARRSLAGGPA